MFINRYMDKEDVYIYIYIYIYIHTHKHNQTLMKLEHFMLTEVNQRETNTVYFHLYVEY